MPEQAAQAEATEMLPPPSGGKTADDIEAQMDAANLAAGGRHSSIVPRSLGEKTQIVLATIRPYWMRTAWWAMLFLSIVVVSLDINAFTGGAIGNALMWLHSVIFKRCPSSAFIGGMLCCYYVIFRGERGSRSSS